MTIDTSKRGFALAFGDLDYPARKVSDRKKDIHKRSITRVDIDWSTSGRLHDIHRKIDNIDRYRLVDFRFVFSDRLVMHGRGRVRHVYGSPCRVADVFGTSTASSGMLADVLGTSTASPGT
ncbi:unnamed protein product [Heligmosomoides polygyrus]|uniref:Transposase n=1 Tax=Heligmosomoides polygyrus TaxID=6339 RepID=A0A183F4V6_HELPZ|nr:unnamed protein product [Heligmosomoides polygyrus]